MWETTRWELKYSYIREGNSTLMVITNKDEEVTEEFIRENWNKQKIIVLDNKTTAWDTIQIWDFVLSCLWRDDENNLVFEVK
jgi:hypothetical protein